MEPKIPTSGPIFDPKMKMYDSAVLSVFETCPFKYFQMFEEGWQSELEDALPLVFGEVTHSGLAVLTKGQSLEDALNTVHNHPKINFGRSATRSPEKIDAILRTWSERWSGSPYQPVKDDGEPVVEFPFTIPVEGFIFAGRLDAVVSDGKEVYVLDHKTTSSISRDCQHVRPHLQFDGYAFACKELFGRCDGVIVDFIEISKTGCSEKHFMRVVSSRSDFELKDYPIQFLNHTRCIEWMRANKCWTQNRTSCFDWFRLCNLAKLCYAGSRLGLRREKKDGS